MEFTEGLHTNTSGNFQPANSYADALNFIFEQNGSLRTEGKRLKIANLNSIPIAFCNFENNTYYLISDLATNTTSLYVIQLDTDFTDPDNPYKNVLLNTYPDLYLKGNGQLIPKRFSASEILFYFYGENQTPAIFSSLVNTLPIPIFNTYADLNISATVTSGGSLPVGTYQIFGRYIDTTTVLSAFSIPFTPLRVFDVDTNKPSAVTNKAIQVAFKNVTKSQVQIVLAYYPLNSVVPEIIIAGKTSGSTFLIAQLPTQDVLTIADVLVPPVKYTSAKAAVSEQSYLFLSNLKKKATYDTDFASWAEKLTVQFKIDVKTLPRNTSYIYKLTEDGAPSVESFTADPFPLHKNTTDDEAYWQPNEVYSLALVPVYKDGTRGPAYPIEPKKIDGITTTPSGVFIDLNTSGKYQQGLVAGFGGDIDGAYHAGIFVSSLKKSNGSLIKHFLVPNVSELVNSTETFSTTAQKDYGYSTLAGEDFDVLRQKVFNVTYKRVKIELLIPSGIDSSIERVLLCRQKRTNENCSKVAEAFGTSLAQVFVNDQTFTTISPMHGKWWHPKRLVGSYADWAPEVTGITTFFYPTRLSGLGRIKIPDVEQGAELTYDSIRPCGWNTFLTGLETSTSQTFGHLFSFSTSSKRQTDENANLSRIADSLKLSPADEAQSILFDNRLIKYSYQNGGVLIKTNEDSFVDEYYETNNTTAEITGIELLRILSFGYIINNLASTNTGTGNLDYSVYSLEQNLPAQYGFLEDGEWVQSFSFNPTLTSVEGWGGDTYLCEYPMSVPGHAGTDKMISFFTTFLFQSRINHNQNFSVTNYPVWPFVKEIFKESTDFNGENQCNIKPSKGVVNFVNTTLSYPSIESYRVLQNPTLEQTEFSNAIIWSQPQIQGSLTDAWRSFLPFNIAYAPVTLGAIKELYVQNGKLHVHGVSDIAETYVNLERLSATNAGEVVLGTGALLTKFQTYSNNYSGYYGLEGCTAYFPTGRFFTPPKQNNVYFLGQGLETVGNPIANQFDKITSFAYSNKHQSLFLCDYDFKKDSDKLLGLNIKDLTLGKVLSFSNILKKWVSFHNKALKIHSFEEGILSVEPVLNELDTTIVGFGLNYRDYSNKDFEDCLFTYRQNFLTPQVFNNFYINTQTYNNYQPYEEGNLFFDDVTVLLNDTLNPFPRPVQILKTASDGVDDSRIVWVRLKGVGGIFAIPRMIETKTGEPSFETAPRGSWLSLTLEAYNKGLAFSQAEVFVRPSRL